MATNVTNLFLKHNNLHKLTAKTTASICNVAHYVQDVKESIALNNNNFPKIIISASGMATGGRVLHHIKNLASDHRNAIIFCGYQAPGTRGEKIVNGSKSIKMFGQHISINCEIINLSGLSAHADYKDILLWLSSQTVRPRKVFITHGEYESSKSLKEKIENKFNWECEIPNYLDEIELC
jgi:metallo-beta-lactamase family protein